MGRGGASDDGPGDRQRRRPAPALLPARMAVSRGIWLAAATAALTVATVLSVTLAGGGGGAGARALTDAWGGAENALASAWGGGEKRANGTKVLITGTKVLITGSLLAHYWHEGALQPLSARLALR